MRKLSRPLLVVTALFLAATTAVAQRHFADVSGKWRVGVAMGDRTSESLVTFKQTGDTLSGVIETQEAGSRPLEGMVKGDTVQFDFTIELQGNVLAIHADGVLKDKDNLSGQMSLPNGMGQFAFAAKREP